jgi:hypothetical protein
MRGDQRRGAPPKTKSTWVQPRMRGDQRTPVTTTSCTVKYNPACAGIKGHARRIVGLESAVQPRMRGDQRKRSTRCTTTARSYNPACAGIKEQRWGPGPTAPSTTPHARGSKISHYIGPQLRPGVQPRMRGDQRERRVTLALVCRRTTPHARGSKTTGGLVSRSRARTTPHARGSKRALGQVATAAEMVQPRMRGDQREVEVVVPRGSFVQPRMRGDQRQAPASTWLFGPLYNSPHARGSKNDWHPWMPTIRVQPRMRGDQRHARGIDIL